MGAMRSSGAVTGVTARVRARAAAIVLAAGLGCLAALSPVFGQAAENPALLRQAFPGAAGDEHALPPFFRDTDLNVHFRTFYFDQRKSDGTTSEAWAVGGWIQYRSGWLLDALAVGATGYTSQPVYAPDDKDGTSLLAPGQKGITVLGEVWGALRYQAYALLRGYRQRVDDGYVNSQDNRMIPNTFEGVTLSGQIGWARYDLGYLWDIKPRNSADFVPMSRQAGAPGADEGLYLASLALAPVKDLRIFGGGYYVPEVFNTAFGKLAYTVALGPDVALELGAQYTDQRSVGAARLGSFKTWNGGAQAWLRSRGLAVGVAGHVTADQASIRTPYGTWPGYLSLIVIDFDRAGEKAFGAFLTYDFGGTLLRFRVPGLSVSLSFGQGYDRRDPSTGSGLPTTIEGDLDVIYNVPAVRGLSLRFRSASVDQGGPHLLEDLRLTLNYELDLL